MICFFVNFFLISSFFWICHILQLLVDMYSSREWPIQEWIRFIQAEVGRHLGSDFLDIGYDEITHPWVLRSMWKFIINIYNQNIHEISPNYIINLYRSRLWPELKECHCECGDLIPPAHGIYRNGKVNQEHLDKDIREAVLLYPKKQPQKQHQEQERKTEETEVCSCCIH